jgi:hypothetical protein
MLLGRHGDPPWGRLAQPSEAALQPQAAGIPGQVRIIYVPENETIKVCGLAALARQKVTCFDPVSGEKTALGIIQADARGGWTCPPPLARAQDWVLAMESP